MESLSREQLQRYAELRKSVEEAKGEVVQAVEEYNDALADLPNIDGVMDEFNQTIVEFNEFCTEISEEIEEYAGERADENDGWTETAQGVKYSKWEEAWLEEMGQADSYFLGEVAKDLTADGLPSTPNLPTSLSAV
tara:strand:- start:133 stop:540 length:408 start_codon:yes stop_codon:yes gene_type:complete